MSGFEALVRRGALAAERARGEAVREVAEQVAQMLPGARVEVRGGGVEVSGRGLLRRWLEDSQFRFAGRR